MSQAPDGKLDLSILAGLLLLSGLLLCTRLANGALWQDEAQTALIAKTILASGIPLGTDGVNFFSQELGAEYGPGHVWRWHTWFPFYLSAGFFALFGASTLTARLPFALCGIGTVLVTYLVGRDLLRSRRGGAVAGILLATSVPFLILSRQARYYSVAALFSMLALYAYRRIAGGGSRRHGILLVTALVLLFHTHYVYYVALLLALLVDALALRREVLRRTALLVAASFALNLPWIVWVATMPYGKTYDVLSLTRAGAMAVSFVRQIGAYVVPWLLLVVPILLLLVGRRRKDGDGWEIAKAAAPLPLYVVLGIAVLSAAAPAPFFRYLAPLLPVLCVLVAWIVEAAARRHLVLGGALLAGLLYFQPLGEYAYELTHTFEGPVDGIVRYLNAHAKPEDVVAITYEDLPVKFYTGLRVLGGLTGEDLTPALGADWVILRKHVVSDKDQRVRQYLAQNLPRDKYEPIRIDSPDTMFQNRESPHEHRFRTAVGEERVVIYRRTAP